MVTCCIQDFHTKVPKLENIFCSQYILYLAIQFINVYVETCKYFCIVLLKEENIFSNQNIKSYVSV